MLNNCHRTFANINRNSFELLFKKFTQYEIKTKDDNALEFDTSKCKNCSHKKLGFSKICEDCDTYREWLHKKKSFVKKSNENEVENSKDLEKKSLIKLSKSQILQYIYYHFLDVIKGKIDFIYEKDLCKYLNISLKTVRRNNLILQQANLIKFKRIAKKLIEISIVGHSEGFEKGESGTVNIPFNFFKEIKNFENIDEIRLSLFMYEKFYSVKQGDNLNYENIFKDILFKDLKKIFAKGKNYEKYIITVLKKLKKFFKITFRDDEFTLISYKTKPKFDDFIYKTRINDDITTFSTKLLKERNVKLTKKLYNDLYQLGSQYGVYALKGAISKMKKVINNKDKSNICAKIRNLIKTHYLIFADRTV